MQPGTDGRESGKSPIDRFESLIRDEARFIRNWLDKPLGMGAVTPSGRFLARMMARYVDPARPGPVIELGPGTGPVTEALIERGVDEGRLVLVEFETEFCDLLRQRYPRARVVRGDAYDLATTLRKALDEPAAAVVSSLPLLTRPERERLALLADAFGLMRPRAPFVQFTYGVLSPIPRDAGGFGAEVSPPVWLNLPPARVWVYRATGDGVGLDPPQPMRDLVLQLRFKTREVGEELRQHAEVMKRRFRDRADEFRAAKPIRPALALLKKIGDRLDEQPPSRRKPRPARHRRRR
jgi:phosphatidylethanolamine/phosphatidyl-N-methylethanolamine N-methyltransferase